MASESTAHTMEAGKPAVVSPIYMEEGDTHLKNDIFFQVLS